MIKKKPTIDYSHNPFTDMLGNIVVEGDCVGSPQVINPKKTRMVISVCEGYDESGIVLKSLNMTTGRWKRFWPRHNNNVVRLNMEEVRIDELDDVYPWVQEIQERVGARKGRPARKQAEDGGVEE